MIAKCMTRALAKKEVEGQEDKAGLGRKITEELILRYLEMMTFFPISDGVGCWQISGKVFE